MSDHKLNTSWILWHHSIENKEWDIKSYNELWTLNTIEDYWYMCNTWDKCLPKLNESMFFIMRKYGDDDKVLPMWEDEHNANGGYWSFKITVDKVCKCWNNLIISVLGETFCKDNENIMGISISPKKHFCIVKIWVNNNTFKLEDIHEINLDDLNINEGIFRSYQ